MREQGEELIILCIIFAVKGSRETGLQLNGGLGIKEFFFNIENVFSVFMCCGMIQKRSKK